MRNTLMVTLIATSLALSTAPSQAKRYGGSGGKYHYTEVNPNEHERFRIDSPFSPPQIPRLTPPESTCDRPNRPTLCQARDWRRPFDRCSRLPLFTNTDGEYATMVPSACRARVTEETYRLDISPDGQTFLIRTPRIAPTIWPQ